MLLLSNGVTPDHVGGLQRYVRELGGALAAKGADVLIVARRRDPHLPLHELASDGVRLLRFDGPAKSNPAYAAAYPLAAARAALGALRAHPDHLVHAHFPLQALPVTWTRRPYLYTFHAPVHQEIVSERQSSYLLPHPAERAVVRAARAIEARVVREASAVVTLSAFMRREVAALDSAAGAGVLEVAGGVDTERMCPGEPVEHPWARADARGPLLFTARRLVPRTGVGELIAAVPGILATHPDARLVVAGAGGLEGALRREVVERGLGERVLLLGRVSDDDLRGWYRAADLAVMPTQELEGFGLSTAEALACGTPVVGTPAGATPELLERLDAGLVTRDATPEAIAAGVSAALADPDRLAAVAMRARATVHPAMAWPAIAERHLELYEYLCREPARP